MEVTNEELRRAGYDPERVSALDPVEQQFCHNLAWCALSIAAEEERQEQRVREIVREEIAADRERREAEQWNASKRRLASGDVLGAILGRDVSIVPKGT